MTSKETTIVQSLDKLMKNTFFNYRGVSVEKLTGGWRALGKKFTRWDELDKAIDETYLSISNSIKKESQ